MDYDHCPCLAYEPDEDEEGNQLPDTCICGHSWERHHPSTKYQADWSCKSEEVAS